MDEEAPVWKESSPHPSAIVVSVTQDILELNTTGFYERLFFLKCCKQADIRQLKRRQNGLRSLVLLLQLQSLPFNMQIITNGVIMNLLLGYGWYLMQCCWQGAMVAYRTIATSLQFCFVKAISRCVHMQIFTIYTSTTCQGKQTLPH